MLLLLLLFFLSSIFCFVLLVRLCYFSLQIACNCRWKWKHIRSVINMCINPQNLMFYFILFFILLFYSCCIESVLLDYFGCIFCFFFFCYWIFWTSCLCHCQGVLHYMNRSTKKKQITWTAKIKGRALLILKHTHAHCLSREWKRKCILSTGILKQEYITINHWTKRNQP